MPYIIDEELSHYGVKGMKWGVRRSQAELDRAAGRKADRRKNFDRFRERQSPEKTAAIGFAAITGIGLAPALVVSGYDISRSAGYSKGKSAAIGIIGGPLGGIVASEVRVRKDNRKRSKSGG